MSCTPEGLRYILCSADLQVGPDKATAHAVARLSPLWRGLFSCRWIAAVELVHHRGDPAGDEHFRRVGRASDHALDVRRFVFLEPREHVIREIPSRISAPDAQPQPGELVAYVLDGRLQAVVPAGR